MIYPRVLWYDTTWHLPLWTGKNQCLSITRHRQSSAGSSSEKEMVWAHAGKIKNSPKFLPSFRLPFFPAKGNEKMGAGIQVKYKIITVTIKCTNAMRSICPGSPGLRSWRSACTHSPEDDDYALTLSRFFRDEDLRNDPRTKFENFTGKSVEIICWKTIFLSWFASIVTAGWWAK